VRGILESLPGDSHERPDVDEVLAEIAAAEHRAGRPLLTALVVTGKSIPGNIFFATARELGVFAKHVVHPERTGKNGSCQATHPFSAEAPDAAPC
jgi:hypothetical protein